MDVLMGALRSSMRVGLADVLWDWNFGKIGSLSKQAP